MRDGLQRRRVEPVVHEGADGLVPGGEGRRVAGQARLEKREGVAELIVCSAERLALVTVSVEQHNFHSLTFERGRLKRTRSEAA